jgi:hypothetical protein
MTFGNRVCDIKIRTMDTWLCKYRVINQESMTVGDHFCDCIIQKKL